ncbi:MAG TPA: GNAT family N-acetyltransferase [Trebonia sp.]|nr:GNAT family N-acetyltransferase [Trebonia sp.]
MITLAHAEPQDVEAIVALLAELEGSAGVAVAADAATIRMERVRSALFGALPAGRALLAWDDRELAGLAGYQFIWPSTGLTTSLYLKQLYVASAYRRTGVGRLMMARLREIAVLSGCTRLEWTADAENEAARSFYRSVAGSAGASLGAEPLETMLFYRVTL